VLQRRQWLVYRHMRSVDCKLANPVFGLSRAGRLAGEVHGKQAFIQARVGLQIPELGVAVVRLDTTQNGLVLLPVAQPHIAIHSYVSR